MLTVRLGGHHLMFTRLFNIDKLNRKITNTTWPEQKTSLLFVSITAAAASATQLAVQVVRELPFDLDM